MNEQHHRTQQSAALVWVRRDLRSTDHAALYHALRQYQRVYCVFVFDTKILQDLTSRQDRRVAFLHACVSRLDHELREMAACHGVQGAGLLVQHGPAVECIPALAQALKVHAVFANKDYEPLARERDGSVASALQSLGIAWQSFKDQALLDCDEVLNQQGRPYSVFTPYYRAWMRKLDTFQCKSYAVQRYAGRLAPVQKENLIPALQTLGFEQVMLPDSMAAGSAAAQRLLNRFAERIDSYDELRDFPAEQATSMLSVHLRFGCISIRQVAAWAWHRAQQGSIGAATWLKQLAWRDFYFMILWHRPDVVSHCYKKEYDRLLWDEAPELFQAWCTGMTGYPLVDAAMRQLNQTGFMHNRLRMVAASFLTKDLGVDWRRGERYFAQQLMDYDLAANNGGWQWASSTGCDAQPWFRIFNPVVQSQRFDPTGEFIRQFVPELAQVPTQHIHFPAAMSAKALGACGLQLGQDYPYPVVSHSSARERTLMRFHFLKHA